MAERIAQLATLMDGTRALRRGVTRDAAGKRELAKEFPKSALVLADVGIDLAVGAFEVGVRYQTRSTIFTSQLPVSRWHEQIGDPTIADGILDRLVHNAHRIEMRGESMRKKRDPPHDENQK